MAAAQAILLTGCAVTTGAGDAGCASYAEARLARPPASAVVAMPPEWATWIADPLLASAGLDRLSHRAHVVIINGPSYRSRGRLETKAELATA